MAARQALRDVPEEATTSVDMDGATLRPCMHTRGQIFAYFICNHYSTAGNECMKRVPGISFKPFGDPTGIVDAVAAAKRALSSHPLPDPFQPSGEAPSHAVSHREMQGTCNICPTCCRDRDHPRHQSSTYLGERRLLVHVNSNLVTSGLRKKVYFRQPDRFDTMQARRTLWRTPRSI